MWLNSTENEKKTFRRYFSAICLTVNKLPLLQLTRSSPSLSFAGFPFTCTFPYSRWPDEPRFHALSHRFRTADSRLIFWTLSPYITGDQVYRNPWLLHLARAPFRAFMMSDQTTFYPRLSTFWFFFIIIAINLSCQIFSTTLYIFKRSLQNVLFTGLMDSFTYNKQRIWYFIWVQDGSIHWILSLNNLWLAQLTDFY